MDAWLVVAILCVIMTFLVVLAIYRLYTLDELKKEYKEKTDEIKQKLLVTQEENARLRTFKYITEDIVTGQRTAEEKVNKIRELLFDRNNNSH